MTLTGARVFPVLGQAYPVLGEVLTVGGTGLAAFQGTLAAQSAITGRDVWTGQKLEFEERLGAVLMAVSNAIFVGVGIASGPKLQAARNARVSAGLATLEPTPPRFEARLINGNPKTGDFTIFIRDAVTGEIASIEGNAHAGHATVTNLTTGEVIGYVRPVSGFGPPAPGGALPAPSGGAPPPAVEIVPVEAAPDVVSLQPKPPAPGQTPIPAPPANIALSAPDPTLMGGPWSPPKSWNGPANHGRWMGVRGNSGWIDDRAEVIRIVGKAPSGEANPIPFRQGVVDFGKWSQGELEVPGLTGEHATDMPMIRRAIADYKGLAKGGSPSAKEKAALDWLRDAPDGYGGKGLRPHHAGGNKIQLIPRDVHKVQHTDVAVYPEGTNEP
jgi:hypothetical protein